MTKPISDKPRTLLITRNLPPLRGGMERLNFHLAQVLSDWGELTVIGPQGCRSHLPEQVTVIEVSIRPLWQFLWKSFLAARHLAKEQKFDLVIAGSGLTAPAVLHAARRADCKAIAYVHGLDLLTPHPIYRAFWRPVLRQLDLALANSANTADIARRLGVARRQVEIVHPGVTLPDPEIDKGNDFRNRHDLGNRPLLLSVGRLTKRKGLVEFVRYSLPLVVEKHPETVLVVIGDDAPNALTGSLSGGKTAVRTVAEELDLSGHLLFLGPCDDRELSRAYYAADVHIFPVLETPGDVEGFGMVAIEAAAHGLPTVAFAVGGVPDAVDSGKSGYLVPANDYRQFSESICFTLSHCNKSQLEADCKRYAESLTWDTFSYYTQIHLDNVIGMKE